MGIGRVWIAIAEEAGFDAFVVVWRVLALSEQVRDERNRVCVPVFNTFLRFQRNQLIRSLSAEGRSPAAITEQLKKFGCEPLTEKHIKRMLSRAKIRA